MRLRETILAALRGDPELKPKLTEALRSRIDGSEGRMSTVVQAAEALAPIIEDAVSKRPSRLGKFGLKSAHLLASLTAEDHESNSSLAKIAHGSTVGIVFVDVAGFTRFTAANGDPAAIELLNQLNAMVDRKTKACGGEV